MANRVLLNDSGLMVSKPGFNVLTASDANLIFSSNWSQLSLLTSGVLSVGPNSSGTVSYGKTYSNMPLLIFQQGVGQYYNNCVEYIDTGVSIAFYERVWSIIAGTSGFSYSTTNSSGSSSINIRYSVWDLDL